MSTAARRYYLRGRAALERGNADTAIESLAAAVELAPSFTSARCAFAIALARVGRGDQASAVLRVGLVQARTASERALLWSTLGDVLTVIGELAAAEEAFERAASTPGYEARAAAGRARVCAKLGRYRDAAEHLARAARVP